MSKHIITKEDCIVNLVDKQTIFKLQRDSDEEFKMLAMIELRIPAAASEDGAEGRVSINGLGLAQSLLDENRLLFVTESQFRNGAFGVVATHRNRWNDIWSVLRDGILPTAGSLIQTTANAGVNLTTQQAGQIAMALNPNNNIVRNAMDRLNGLEYDDNGFPRRRGGCGMLAGDTPDFLTQVKQVAYEAYLDKVQSVSQQQSVPQQQQQIIPQQNDQRVAANSSGSVYEDDPF